MSAHKIQTLGNHTKGPYDLWRWSGQIVPKCRHIKFRCRGITQKKEYSKTHKTCTHIHTN